MTISQKFVLFGIFLVVFNGCGPIVFGSESNVFTAVGYLVGGVCGFVGGLKMIGEKS